MNTKLTALLSTAIVTGLFAAQVARADNSTDQKADHTAVAEKNSCKGEADKNSCKGHNTAKKKKKSDKNSCKNGCGEAEAKKE